MQRRPTFVLQRPCKSLVVGVAVVDARALHLVFWASSFHELNDKAADAAVARRIPGHFVVVAQAVNLLFMADYVWAYLIAARAKKPFLPTSATQAI